MSAAELLGKEIGRSKHIEGIGIGDYQPAEMKFGLSRKMLEVVRDAGWPTLLLEKSDLVLRDVDIFQQINAK